ncbi:ATP-binding protein [Streptomyces sp. NPDC029674]|uniref:ATP-binding protein n=1 Tax=Streptomyces sp. NPDC029674 TaxID=3365297 RepID=UPI00384E6F27
MRVRGLVGRTEELGMLRGMLARGRLVTVVGGAGVGKSLLAEHAAAAVGSSMADGVVRVRWWDGTPPRRRSVAQAVAEAADGGEEGPGASVGVAELAARLRSRRMLLLLDDFDPVRGECVRLVRALLDVAPEVRVLTAGRHPLGLGEEAVLRLGPLRTDTCTGEAETADTGTGTGTAEVGIGADTTASSESEPTVGPAVTLFLERLHAARHRAEHGTPPHGRNRPTPEDRADEPQLAHDICRLLDGVPLAVELAAAQAARYPLAQLARMLESSQGWLGRPDAPLRRHRSLRAAVGAGYALCGTAERTVWARLSVFAGSFDEDAAVYVCSGGGLDAQDVPAALARLVLASVLEPVRDPGGVLTPRYRMPAAARGFGAERLQSAGETAAAVSRHLYWYAHVASTAHHLWSIGTHGRAVALVRDEEPDLRAALDREPSGTDEASTMLSLAVDLWFWWAVCGHAEEGRVLLNRLLPPARSGTRLYGQALWLCGWLAVCTGSPEAVELLGQAWRVAVLAGDDATVGRVSHVLGALALEAGSTERAIAHLREAAETIPVHAEHGPPAAVSWALLAVAQAGVSPGDAWRSVRRASAGPQPRHDLWTRSMTQYAQAVVDHLRGRRSRAWRRAHKALAGAAGVVGAAEVPALAAMAGPPRAAVIHQLIAEIEAAGPRPGEARRRTGAGTGCSCRPCRSRRG